MPSWLSTLIDVATNWLASILPAVVVGIIIWLVIAALMVIAWRRRHQQLAKDEAYRAVLRKFVLAPVFEMNEALNDLRWEMTHRYNGPNKESLNELFEQRFEHAILVPYSIVARVIKAEADLSVIEEALRRYFNNYRAEPANLRRYMSLSGIRADDALWKKWLAADERCFSAFQKLKAVQKASGLTDLADSITDRMTLAINAPWE